MKMNFCKIGSRVNGYRVMDDDEQIYTGYFDFADCTFHGKSGKTLVGRPQGFNSSAYVECFDGDEPTLEERIAYSMQNLLTILYRHDLSAKEFAIYEKLMSLGLGCQSYWDLHYSLDGFKNNKYKLNKKFLQYCQQNSIVNFSTSIYDRYQQIATIYDVIEKYGQETVDMATDCLPENKRTKSYISKMCKLLKNEHISSLRDGIYMNLSSAIRQGLQKRITLYDDNFLPERNLLLEICTSNFIYQQKKDEMIDKALVWNDIPQLYYQNDDFSITPLTTAAAFHDEAAQQNNCVERLYMEKVAQHETHVVHVRSKSNPQKSYITCEVDNHGNIIQFLLSCNRGIWDDDTAKALRNEYQLHLHSQNWDE